MVAPTMGPAGLDRLAREHGRDRKLGLVNKGLSVVMPEKARQTPNHGM
jgi:hypothetical protein